MVESVSSADNTAEADAPELVFGLVGAIGTNLDMVQSSLCSSLRSVGYKPKVIHLSNLLSQASNDPTLGTLTYEKKIEQANTACESAQSRAFLAALAVKEIWEIRSESNAENRDDLEENENALTPLPRTAFIIRQLKREEEVAELKKIYGKSFLQVSVTLDQESRFQNLKEKIARDEPSENPENCIKRARDLIEIDLHQAKVAHGQRVDKIFHLADVFISGRDATSISSGTQRFIEAFFGNNTISPSKDELGSYFAKAASLRSIDPSRQVGAAILTQDGDIVSIGCNDVPKSGGGIYWQDDQQRFRDIEIGFESNKVETKRIVFDFLKRLERKGLLKSDITASQAFDSEEMSELLEDALVTDITEFGRMTHAEMSAICDAARLGRPIKDAIIYVTTFPCHNCAKHIVASGINKVVYIEPYPKSKAKDLHRDSLELDGSSERKVQFSHFEGISPRRYRDIFEKGRRKVGGKLSAWVNGFPTPMAPRPDPNYTILEAAFINAHFDVSD